MKTIGTALNGGRGKRILPAMMAHWRLLLLVSLVALVIEALLLPCSGHDAAPTGVVSSAHPEETRPSVPQGDGATPVTPDAPPASAIRPVGESGVNFLLPHAHGSCLGWQPFLLWLHIGSDFLTALAYFSIPVALLVFARRRRDLQFGWMFVLFSIFIMACGATHLMSIWTLWTPAYLMAGVIKAVTAIASVITAAILWPLLPKALALPGPAQWEAVNNSLRNEIEEHRKDEDEVRRLNEELERKVEERSRQLQEAQEELVRQEKLAILGQLSGSVGHELRNPLGVMSNAVYFLQMVLSDTDEITREYLGIIKHEVDTSQRIITDLLDFARTKTPQIKAVTARELVTESLARCAIPENVELRTEFPETLPAVRVDPLQIGQVLQNLVTNAVQAMANGGSLRVAARRVRAIHESPLQNPKQETGDVIVISVADSGEGISPENMKKLFQPLFTTKPRGIGLGLVVCRNLTEANGGKLEVESRLGEGTTFTVMLPMEMEVRDERRE